ncbi:MAG: MFS transporter [Candidatus Methylacidiphilales bacterium]|nr:MFS transporter [Candidatus Methylacidiphilales bacterium]
MENETTRPGLVRVLLAQAQVAFHDNAVKLVLIGLASAVLSPAQAAHCVSILALLLVVPFVMFGPLAGWMADRFAKDRIFRWALVAQAGITLWVMTAVHLEALGWAVAGFFLLGLQATFFSPAKRGILKDLVGSRRLAQATGASESLVVLSILVGSVVGGAVFDQQMAHQGGPWIGAFMALAIFLTGCVGAWLLVWGVRAAPVVESGARPFEWSLVWGHGAQVAQLVRQPGLFKAALGEAAFYFMGGAVMVSLTQWVQEDLAGALGTASRTGFLMALMGGGVILGSLLAAGICRRTIRLGLVPLGAMFMTLALWLMAVTTGHPMAFAAALMLLGVSGGLFLVPVSSYLQDRSREDERGNILAATNLLSSLGGMLAVGLQFGLASMLHVPVRGQLLVYGFLAAGLAVYLLFLLPDEVLRLAGLALARAVYPTRIVGAENIPNRGGVLIVCNHVSYADTFPLAGSCVRPIRFLSLDSLFKVPLLGVVLRIFGCIPVSPHKAKEALKRASEALQRGEVVCLFPEGQLTRTGSLMELKPGFELIARRAGCPVVVAHLDGLWGSIFSFAGGRYFFKWPARWRVPITVTYSKPLAPEEATTARVRQLMLEMGADAFAGREEVRNHLGRALLRQMKTRPWETQLVDCTDSPRSYSRGRLLSASLALAGRWKRTLPARRVGVVLPPGYAGTVTNLALIFAGKIPVNLNPTAGPSAAGHSLKSAGVETVITAAVLRRKLGKFPWPEQTLDLADEAAKLGIPEKISALIGAWAVPYRYLKHRLGLPARGGDEEAALLFTSGSSGLPKGVPLSHANLLGNALQIRDIELVQRHDRILSGLPLFHSFGLTVGLLCPLLGRWTLVTVPSPLESDKIARAGREGKASLLLGTPTFLRQWMKRMDTTDFPNLRLAITGAEKLPAPLAQAFQEKFHAPVMEGYGLTETSPVASFNLPDPGLGLGAGSVQKGHRPGSVGRMLPGLAARLTDPATGEPMLTGPGILAFRGVNVLKGYLGGQESDKFHQGWFLTGDLARFDDDGFLYIEGRLSRFSKVGGEMVPHLAVEEAIQKAFPAENEKIPDCVLGLPDGEKGEQLVLLTTRTLDLAAVRDGLAAAGMPNLWVPKKILPVENIPVLGSGKLDFGACKKLAEELARS